MTIADITANTGKHFLELEYAATNDCWLVAH